MFRPEIEPGPPRRGGEHSSKELFEPCINSYSEHLHLSPRNTYFICVQPSYGGSRRELGKLEFPPGESPTVCHLAIYCGNSLADCSAPLPPPSHVPALLCRAVDVVRWAQLQKSTNEISAVYSVHCTVADPDSSFNADWYKDGKDLFSKPVLRIHDILAWIRIRIRILPFSSLPFKAPTKNYLFLKKFFCYYFLKVHLHHFSKINR